MKLSIRLILLFFLILSACTPTAFATNNIPQDNLPRIISTLKPKSDYIFYEDRKSDGDEIWAINPENEEKMLIAKGKLSLSGWSPSGDYWLFQDNDSLYVASADGSNIQRIYQFLETDNCGELVSWLSDSILLIDVYSCDTRNRLLPPPHQYYLNIINGAEGRIDPVNEFDETGTFLIQGIIPKEEKWIQINWYTGELEIADLKGNHNQILDGMELRTDALSWSMEFVPKTRNVVFHAWRDDDSVSGKILDGLWLMSTKTRSPELILEGAPDVQIREYHVSPSGEFLAFAYDKGQQYIVAFYSLRSKKVEYKWNFPYRLSFPRFVWSPDSRYIALPYSDDANNEGIQIMDISNGQTRQLISENVWMIGWHEIGY